MAGRRGIEEQDKESREKRMIEKGKDDNAEAEYLDIDLGILIKRCIVVTTALGTP